MGHRTFRPEITLRLFKFNSLIVIEDKSDGILEINNQPDGVEFLEITEKF